jgi:hypothetical protein
VQCGTIAILLILATIGIPNIMRIAALCAMVEAQAFDLAHRKGCTDDPKKETPARNTHRRFWPKTCNCSQLKALCA